MRMFTIKERSWKSGQVYAFAALFIGVGFFNGRVMGQRGVQINLDPNTGQDVVGDAANEPTLAVSPVDPSVMVVGWRYFPVITSDSRFAGVAYSHDGGLSWTNEIKLDAPPGFQNSAEQSDPVLTVNSAGIFYYWSELFRPVNATHHFVYQSLDGGVNWTDPTLVQDPAQPGDKEWFIADRTGGIGDGNLYGGWNNFNLGGQSFVRSTDGGNSFSSPVRMSDAGGTQWMLHFATGPDGEVYGAWRNMSKNAIYITKSLKARDANQVPTFDGFGAGGNFGKDIKIDNGNDPGFLPVSPVGFHQIYVAVDKSNGVRRGWVYVLWADRRNDICDIYFARSRDGGFTWDASVRVNDDQMGNGAYQWMPAMSVSPKGRIDVVWYDSRNSQGHNPPWMELYFSKSEDGGSSWSSNERLSESFDTTVGYPSQAKIGDYIQTDSDNMGMNIVYSATFNGGQDLYFMRKNVFALDVPRLVAGADGEFNVTGAKGNTATYLAYSVKGEGSTFVAALNVTLGLNNPKQAGGKKTTDAAGDTQWVLAIPGGISGKVLWFQAAQFENVSNVEIETVG